MTFGKGAPIKVCFCMTFKRTSQGCYCETLTLCHSPVASCYVPQSIMELKGPLRIKVKQFFFAQRKHYSANVILSYVKMPPSNDISMATSMLIS